MQREINGKIVYFELTDHTIEMTQMRHQTLGSWLLELIDDLYLSLEINYV